MVLRHFKRLFDPFADGNARHYDDEFGKPVAFIELEHRFNIHIRLARARLHLHVQIDRAELLRESLRLVEIRKRLNIFDIGKQLLRRELDARIGKADIVLFLQRHITVEERHLRILLCDAFIHCVQRLCPIRLPFEHIRDRLHRIRLILLYFEFEFHELAYRRFYTFYYFIREIVYCFIDNRIHLSYVKMQSIFKFAFFTNVYYLFPQSQCITGFIICSIVMM